MATIQNTYTGNGSTVLYSFTFPYLATTDIKVSVNGTNTTAYTLANATTVQFTAAPANGAAIRIYRSTDDSQTKATFFPGSSIRAQGLNDNFLQVLYVVQESETRVTETDLKSAAAQTAANTATTQANLATTSANAATATANVAISQSTSAVNTANSSTAAASSAVNTANAAVTTANNANNTANQAIAAISNSIAYTLVANVAAIPATPANNTYVEVQNSTGIQSFSPLAGLPGGFVGDAGLTVRLYYTSAGATWNYLNYFSNNPENRYLKLTGGTLTGVLNLAAAPTSNLHPATKAYVDGYVSALSGDIGSLSSSKLDSGLAASTYQTLSGMSTYLTTASAASTYQPIAGMGAYLVSYTTTTTATSKTLSNRERCSVTTTGLTITLPANPQAGWEVSITNASNGTDTLISRNGSNIMSLAEDLTIDRANATVTLYYVDATRGWRII
jgi:hypothetical protein